jgi:hypothetical protein
MRNGWDNGSDECTRRLLHKLVQCIKRGSRLAHKLASIDVRYLAVSAKELHHSRKGRVFPS